MNLKGIRSKNYKTLRKKNTGQELQDTGSGKAFLNMIQSFRQKKKSENRVIKATHSMVEIFINCISYNGLISRI